MVVVSTTASLLTLGKDRWVVYHSAAIMGRGKGLLVRLPVRPASNNTLCKTEGTCWAHHGKTSSPAGLKPHILCFPTLSLLLLFVPFFLPFEELFHSEDLQRVSTQSDSNLREQGKSHFAKKPLGTMSAGKGI